MLYSSLEKETHVNAIRTLMNDWLKKKKYPPEKCCLYWAAMCYKYFSLIGEHPLLQGGSAAWRRLPVEKDDGLAMTHFAYVWENDHQKNVAAIKGHGVLPEVHYWIALRNPYQLIDVTTCFLKQQCKTHGGMEWLMPDPPPYIWTLESEFPADGSIHYTPDMHAIVLGMKLLALHTPELAFDPFPAKGK